MDLPAGTYYLAVGSLGNTGFDYELALDTTLDATRRPSPTGPRPRPTTLIAPFDSAYGTTSGASRPRLLRLHRHGHHRAPQRARTPGQRPADLHGLRRRPRSTPRSWLYATDGTTQLGYNDDIGGGNYCARLTYGSLTVGQRYVVKVTRSGAAAVPASATVFSYVLTLRP